MAGLLTTAAPADAKKPGKLVVKVGGLPKGTPVDIKVVGPKHASAKKGSKRRLTIRISRAKRTVVRNAPPGRYRIVAKPVRVSRNVGAIKRGARAIPDQAQQSVKVRRGKTTKSSSNYGTVVNPYTRKKVSDVLAIEGPSANPSSVLFKGRVSLKRGDVISVPPGGSLPAGLLAKVTSVKSEKRNTRVGVRAASMFEVVPSINVTKRVDLIPVTAVKAGLDLGVSNVVSSCGLKFGVKTPVQHVVVSTDWSHWKVPIVGKEIVNGAQMLIGFDLVGGFSAESEVGGSCGDTFLKELELATTIGPIPVVGKVRPHVGATLDVPAKAEVVAHMPVTLGGKAVAALPGFPGAPAAKFEDASKFGDITFDPPKVEFGSLDDIGVTFDMGIALSAGLGNQVADVSVESDQGLEFQLEKDRGCHWDFFLGRLSIEASAGPFSLSSPSWTPIDDQELANLGACARLFGDGTDEPGGPYSQNQIFDRSALTSGGEGGGLAISTDGKSAVSGRVFNSGDSLGPALSVFTRNEGRWNLQKLIEPQGDPFDFDGSILDMSGDGNTIAVASYDEVNQRPAVETFTRSGSNWIPGDAIQGIAFTSLDQDLALSYDGSRLAVAGETKDLYDLGGAVTVYRRASGHWVLEDELSPSPEYGDTSNAVAVDISNDGTKIAATYSGILEVYEREGSDWGAQLASDFSTPIDGPRSWVRNVAISGSGNTVAVGVPSYGDDVGRVTTFERTATGWVLGPTLSSDLQYPLYFGYGVALSTDGTKLLTRDSSDNADNSIGGLVAFERSGEGWTKTQRIGPGRVSEPLTYLGYSTAMSGDAATVLTRAELRDSVDDAEGIFVLISFGR